MTFSKFSQLEFLLIVISSLHTEVFEQFHLGFSWDSLHGWPVLQSWGSNCGKCWRAPSQDWNDGVSIAEKTYPGRAKVLPESPAKIKHVVNCLIKGQHTYSSINGFFISFLA